MQQLLIGMIVTLFLGLPVNLLMAQDNTLTFETYSGYFVSNKFEPEAANSFVLLQDAEAFDQVFGVAFVMGDTAKRLPENLFEKHIVLGAIKRGAALWDFTVKKVNVNDAGKVEIHYTAKVTPQEGATFSCPMIVSIPRGDYTSLTLIENGNEVKTLKLSK